MGIFYKNPEEIAQSEARKAALAESRDEEKRKNEELRRKREFAQSPAGQAKAARDAGVKTFQLSLSLSRTTGHTIAMTGVSTDITSMQHATIIDSIEAQGWHLEHAGYVYRVTGSVSRDKFLSSGQQEAVHGEIVGIYIFRAT